MQTAERTQLLSKVVVFNRRWVARHSDLREVSRSGRRGGDVGRAVVSCANKLTRADGVVHMREGQFR